jgi:hypothetical protein
MRSLLRLLSASVAGGIPQWQLARGNLLATPTAGNPGGALTDEVAVAVNANAASVYTLTAPSNATRVIQVPTGGVYDQLVTIMFANSSGAALTATSFHTNILQSSGIMFPATGETQVFQLRKVTASLWALEVSLAQVRGVLLATRVHDGGVFSRGAPDTTVAHTIVKVQYVGAPGAANTYVSLSASAGRAFGALGTIPANMWGAIGLHLWSAFPLAPVFQSAPANYTTGYASAAAALAAMAALALPAPALEMVRMGIVVIQASAATFIVGTDALAGGATGNPAAATQYFTCGYDYTGLMAD